MALCLVMSTGLWSCNDEDVDGDEPVLSVEPTALTFAASGSELTKSFELTANREWSIEVTGEDKTWVSVDPLKGEGKATINVTVLPNAGAERSVTLKIVSSINTASVSVVQSPGDGSVEKSVILDENIGDEKAVQDGTQWPAVNAFTGWKKGGTGAAEVTYMASNASVRANSFSDDARSTSDYSKNQASGGNNILLKGGATFDVCGITLTEAQTKLKLTFGIERNEFGNYDAPYKNEEFTVALSADGEKWTEPITYTRSDYSSWDLATADFTLSQAATKLYIRFKAVSVDGRIDDITLTTGEGGQTVDLNATSGGEEEENDGTVGNYPMTAVASFTEVFDAVENNKLFTSDQWAFYSNDKLYATTPALGWQGKTYNTDKYIAVAPFNSGLSEVTAYAIMAPFDVKAAATKTLTFDLTWYYLDSPDDSKLEVVASTDFAGNVKTATWHVVKDCSFASDAAKNDWVSLSADLSSYANENKVYIAFRYTGKGNTYRLDNVAFGTEIGISFGTPAFSGIMKVGTALSGTKISIPYTNAKGTESYDITVAVSGEAAAGIDPVTVTKNLTAGDGNIELDITGTPTTAGSVTFSISGVEGLTTNTVNAVVSDASSGVVYETGFEDSGEKEGKTNNYTTDKEFTLSGIKWNMQGSDIIHTGGPAVGTWQWMGRVYKNKTDVPGLWSDALTTESGSVSTVEFKAIGVNTVNMKVYYSTDGSTWNAATLAKGDGSDWDGALTTTYTDYMAKVNASGAIRLKFTCEVAEATDKNRDIKLDAIVVNGVK